MVLTLLDAKSEQTMDKYIFQMQFSLADNTHKYICTRMEIG